MTDDVKILVQAVAVMVVFLAFVWYAGRPKGGTMTIDESAKNHAELILLERVTESQSRDEILSEGEKDIIYNNAYQAKLEELTLGESRNV